MSEVDDFLNRYEQGNIGQQPAGQRSEVDELMKNAPAEDKGVLGHARDIGLSLAKTVIAVPEMAVGLADIPTGGAVGKLLENEDGLLGFRPKQAKEFLSDLHTDRYKEQQQEFQQADGILDKAGVALSNPSLIVNTVTESVGPMLAGGAIGRGVSMATKVGPTASAAIGEGAAMAGSQAEAIRQETDDGYLTPGQSGAALATGALGGVFGYAGGRLAQKLGIGDVDTMLAQGISPTQIANDLASAPAKSVPRQVIEGAISEGFLEELPQSVSEQVIQNLALDKPWHEGVEDAVVMGALAGMAMGGPAAGFSALTRPRVEPAGEVPAGAPAAAQEPEQEPAPLLALPAPVYEAGADGTIRTTEDLNSANQAQRQSEAERLSRIARGEVIDVTPVPVAPKQSEQMGLDPNAGPMSAAAALAVDSGASQQLADQAALQQAAEIAQQQAKGKGKAAEPMPRQGELIDPETGEIVSAEPDTGARIAQLMERLDYLSQQAKRTGWNKAMVDDRDRTQSELDALMPAAERPQAKAKDAAKQVLAAGGSEADAGRAATDSLINDMERSPEISIAAEAPAAVEAAKQEIAAPASLQEGIAQVRAEKAAEPADIKAITAKQIPQMTDAEIEQAIAYYGPDNKRTAKLKKEQAKRASAPVAAGDAVRVSDGLGSDIDGMDAKVIGVNGDYATLEVGGERYQDVPVSEITKTQQQQNQQPENTDGIQAPQAQQAGTKRAQAPGAAAEAVPAATESAAGVDEAGARWDAMTPAERQVAAEKAGVKPVFAKNLPSAGWDRIGASVRAKLAEVIDPELAASLEKSKAGAQELAARAAAHEEYKRADGYEKSVRELASGFPGTYMGRPMAPLASDIADHAIKNNRRLTDGEIQELGRKHDIPVDVVEQLVGQPFAYDGIKGDAERGNPGAKALRAKKAAPADQATVSPETVTAPAPAEASNQAPAARPAERAAETGRLEPTNSLQGEPASWVVRNRETGEVVMETFDKKKVDALNVAKYEAVPIQQYLGEVNQAAKSGEQAAVAQASKPALETADGEVGAQQDSAPSASDSAPAAPNNQPSEQMSRTAEQAVAKMLRKVADEVEAQGTGNGSRKLDTRWAEGAIKRLLEANGVNAMLSGKQYGALASAKIALGKERVTIEGLRAIAEKLERSVAESSQPAPQASAYEAHNEEAEKYGYSVNADGEFIRPDGKPAGAKVTESKGRMRIVGADGELLFTGPGAQSVGKFLESYWYAEKKRAPKPVQAAPAKASALDAAADKISDAKREKALKLKALLDSRKGTLNSGVDPEIMVAVAELGALTLADGAVKFAQWVRDVIRSARAVGIADDDVKPFLKEAYGAIASNPEKYGVTDDRADAMDTPREIRAMDVDAIVAKGDELEQASSPQRRFELLREHGTGENPEVAAFSATVGATGERPADVYNRWQSVFGFAATAREGSGADLARLMRDALVKEPYRQASAYPGSNPPAVSDLKTAQRFAERTEKAMQAFNANMDSDEQRAADAERFGVDEQAIKVARDAIQQMRRTAAENERAAQR